MEADLPDLIDVPCPHCKGVATTGTTETASSVSVSYCLVCRNTGHTVEPFPRECPWCAAPVEVDAITRYSCGAAYGNGRNSARPVSESSCGRVSDALAGRSPKWRGAGIGLREAGATTASRLAASTKPAAPGCACIRAHLQASHPLRGTAGSPSYCIPCAGTGHVQEYPLLCPGASRALPRAPMAVTAPTARRGTWADRTQSALHPRPIEQPPSRGTSRRRGEPLLTVLQTGRRLPLREIRATAPPAVRAGVAPAALHGNHAAPRYPARHGHHRQQAASGTTPHQRPAPAHGAGSVVLFSSTAPRTAGRSEHRAGSGGHQACSPTSSRPPGAEVRR